MKAGVCGVTLGKILFNNPKLVIFTICIMKLWYYINVDSIKIKSEHRMAI